MQEIEIRKNEDNKEATTKLILFKQLFLTLGELAEQLEILISKKGFTIQIMDSMHVCLADVFISTDMFTYFRCDEDIKVGIELKIFNLIIKNSSVSSEEDFFKITCGNSNSIGNSSSSSSVASSSVVDSDGPSSMRISYGNKNSKFNYDLKLCKISTDSFETPECDFTSSVKLELLVLKDILRNIGIFGNEHISFLVKKDQMEIYQENATLKGQVLLIDNQSSILVNCTSPVNTKINKKYFELMGKMSSFSDRFEISFMDNNSPVLFDLKFSDISTFKMFVAPQES